MCVECGRSAAASRRGGIHENCASEARARAQVREDGFGHIDDGWEEGGWAAKLRSLPTIHNIFTVQGSTREFSHRGLRALYRGEFGRLCGRVANYNLVGAWDHMAEPVGREITDTPSMKRCRVAWIELSMFAKTVLRADVRGIGLVNHSYMHAIV